MAFPPLVSSPLKPFNDDFRSLAPRFLHAKATPIPGYLVKRIGIWRKVGDEGVTRLVVGSDLQVLLLAYLHQPPIYHLYLVAMSNQRSFKIESFRFGAFVPKKIEYIRF